jgi:hypothetical protein
MRTIACAALVLSLGCSHVRVASFDNTDNTFVLCGNDCPFCSLKEDMEKEALHSCVAGGPVLLRCGSEQEIVGATWKGNTLALHRRNTACCTYQCR